MPGYSNALPGTPTVLSVATQVNFSKGVPGTVGVANDTILNSIKIAQNGVAVTVTINGYRDQANAAAAVVFTGSTSSDTFQQLGWLNTLGPLNITASVANKVMVETITSGFVP